MRVIALDPGKLTGWAAANIDDNGDWTEDDHGIMTAKAVVLWLHERAMRRHNGQRRPLDVIVYEDWVLYAGHVAEYVGSDMPYSQQIGQYRLISWLSNTPIVKQPAGRKDLARRQAEAFRPALAAEIHRIASRAHKDGHDGDALLHLWAYTVDHFPNLRKQS